jgi:hypothetical protein
MFYNDKVNFMNKKLLGLFISLSLVTVACGPLKGEGAYNTKTDKNTSTTISANDPFGPPKGSTAPEEPQNGAVPPPQPNEGAGGDTGGSGASTGAELAKQQLNSLAMNDDFGSLPKYDRNKFKHWTDLDGNRCDARQDVLIRQSIGNKAQVDPFGCTVVAGDWFSEYDAFTTSVPGELDIDHVVALGEGWRAGAWQWDDKKREKFANDLDSRQLIAVSAKSNRSKSDKRPDEWMPPRGEFRCQFLFDWVSVKHKWELTVATPEKNFINKELETC